MHTLFTRALCQRLHQVLYLKFKLANQKTAFVPCDAVPIVVPVSFNCLD